MMHGACESKLRSVVRSSMHPYPGNWVAIGRAVVYYVWTAREFSAGIKFRHCSYITLKVDKGLGLSSIPQNMFYVVW